jgi:hypothetical protein
MTQNHKSFTVVDPRSMDGNPYDVAERAALQAGALAHLLAQIIQESRLMIRNAELSRQMALEEEPDPTAWENGPQSRKLSEAYRMVLEAGEKLNALARAASYDPLHPPKE